MPCDVRGPVRNRIASVAYHRGFNFNELRGRCPAITRILTRQVAGFSGRCGYDVSHLQGLIAAVRAGAVKELLVGPFIQHRFGLPSAGLLRRQDLCYPVADYGSFLKFAIDMAVEAGLPLVAIRQLLLGPAKEAPPETRLVPHTPLRWQRAILACAR